MDQPYAMGQSMSAHGQDSDVRTVRLQELMGRQVVDAGGRRVGRVVDFQVERCGDQLCVVALTAGPRTWVARFGWASPDRARHIAWEEIERLDPEIVLRGSSPHRSKGE